MKPFEIWMEGVDPFTTRRYASMMGVSLAKDFKSACIQWAKTRMGAFPDEAGYYNMELNTYWNCRLFDNEQDALNGFIPEV